MSIRIICFLTFCMVSCFPDPPDLYEPEYTFSGRKYICYRTQKPISIDGRLDEKAWIDAPWTEYFEDIEGDKQPKPLYETRAKLLWDDTYLYIAAELEEPHLWATLTERESVIFYDNDFEVFLDPDGDTHHYYEFEVNALGTEWDLMLLKPYRDGGPAVNGWDINGIEVGIELRGSLNDPTDTDSGWVVEIAMPWNILKEAAPRGERPIAGDQWRMDFSRVQWRLDVENNQYKKRLNPETNAPFPEYNWVWSAPGLISMHEPEKWGYLQFSDIPSGNGKEIFEEKSDEAIKWALRELYNRQRAYFETHGTYTNSLTSLGLENLGANGRKLHVDIVVAHHSYVASTSSFDNRYIWLFRDDSRIWKSPK